MDNDLDSQVVTPLQALPSSTVSGDINLQNDYKKAAKIMANESRESVVEQPPQFVLDTTRLVTEVSSETSHEFNNFSPSQQEQEQMELNVTCIQRNTDTFSNVTSNRSSNIVLSAVTFSHSLSQHLAVKSKTLKSSSVTTSMCVHGYPLNVYHLIMLI